MVNGLSIKMKRRIKKYFYSFYLLYTRLKDKIDVKLISDKDYVKRKFIKNFGVIPDIENPKRYNEYISKILLTEPDPLMVQCADKYEVRKYVSEKIGDFILNDLYGVYNNVKELENDWNNLPEQFVLKATHGCSWNYICKDKKKVNLKKIKPLFNHWLKHSFYYAQREKIYKQMTPRIIAEKYLEDETGELIDYKIHCFNGEPKFINVIVNRFSNMKLNTYDINWNFIDVTFDPHYPNDPHLNIEKPENLDQMLNFSKILSNNFNYVRVDFYIVFGKIYFGELTFTPGNGAYTSFTYEDDLYLGSFFN